MPISFTVSQPTVIVAAAIDPLTLGGEDISLLQGTLGVTSHRDWVTVRGVDAARQSVLREGGATRRSFLRRPDYGYLQEFLFKGATASNRDAAVSQIKSRLTQNQRVKKIREVTGRLGDSGLQITIRVDSVDGPLNIVDQVFK